MMVVGKKIKSVIVIAIWGLAVIAFAFTLLQVFNPGEQSIDKVAYSSDISSTIDYSVRLDDTPVYGGAKDADPSKYYVMPFTDYMTLNCSYSYNGSSAADITASSYITAFLVSYILDADDEVELWKKEYTLSELESTQVIDVSALGENSIRVSFDEYTNLITQIEEEYNFQTSYYLMIVYTTEFNVVQGASTQNRILQPYIKVHFEDLIYEVEESPAAEAAINLINTEVVIGEINWDFVIISGIIFLIFAATAALLPSKIIGKVPLSEEARAIRQITVKYGDRIVKIVDKPILSDSTVRLESIEDVMKIADEIGQPIFSVAIDKETYYYVNNNGVIYYIALTTQ